MLARWMEIPLRNHYTLRWCQKVHHKTGWNWSFLVFLIMTSWPELARSASLCQAAVCRSCLSSLFKPPVLTTHFVWFLILWFAVLNRLFIYPMLKNSDHGHLEWPSVVTILHRSVYFHVWGYKHFKSRSVAPIAQNQGDTVALERWARGLSNGIWHPYVTLYRSVIYHWKAADLSFSLSLEEGGHASVLMVNWKNWWCPALVQLDNLQFSHQCEIHNISRLLVKGIDPCSLSMWTFDFSALLREGFPARI